MKKLLLLFASFVMSSALAQDYPSRPIRVVVPYSAGGSSDGPMRVIAQEMSRQLGQQMVVENKPGQGAMLGSAEVAKAPADGYTLLLASNPNAISASLYSRLTHDPVEDFAPISLLASEQADGLVRIVGGRRGEARCGASHEQAKCGRGKEIASLQHWKAP